jgi:hypothetical protein
MKMNKIRLTNFSHAIYIDWTQEFPQTLHQKDFHSFLLVLNLDEEFRGTPRYSQQINPLYILLYNICFNYLIWIHKCTTKCSIYYGEFYALGTILKYFIMLTYMEKTAIWRYFSLVWWTWSWCSTRRVKEKLKRGSSTSFSDRVVSFYVKWFKHWSKAVAEPENF